MQQILPALILALSIAVAGSSIGAGLEHFRLGDRSILIKGLAEQTVESDFVTWPLTVRRAGNSFDAVYQALTTDRDKIIAFLRSLGFTDDELEVRPLAVTDKYSREYAQRDTPTRYAGSALVVVKSNRVEAVANAAMGTDPLIAAGVQLEFGSGPQYELRAFNDVKGPLLAAATANALEQAEAFAANAGAELGKLKSANQGIIQISGTAGNPYDAASSKTKRLRVVSTFSYYLK